VSLAQLVETMHDMQGLDVRSIPYNEKFPPLDEIFSRNR